MFHQVARDGGSVVKTYRRADTARFKPWGSGVRNEALAARELGGCVPRLLRAWDTDEAEYARLEWIEGRHLDPAGGSEAVAAGRMLGRIHSRTAGSWGSLDGAVRFDRQSDALLRQVEAAGRLLDEHGSISGALFVERCRALLAGTRYDEPPTLVHGDFSPPNLVRSGDALVVLDWEHARWGHPLEDWSHLRLGIRFAGPNSFGADERILQDLAAGWSEATGRPPPLDPPLERALDAMYAAILGVFFGGTPNHRLQWLDEILR